MYFPGPIFTIFCFEKKNCFEKMLGTGPLPRPWKLTSGYSGLLEILVRMTLCVMGSVVRTPVTELYRSSHGDAVFVYLLLFLCLCVALCLILVLSFSFSVPSYFAIILLRKRDMCGSRKFCQRGSKFNSFFVCLFS